MKELKDSIVAEIARILGDRATASERDLIATCAIKIVEDYNRLAALAAMETVKKTLVQETKDSAAKE